MIRLDIIRSISRIGLCAILAVIASCATSSTRVTSSHDPEADFSQYRSFEFANPLSVDRNGARSSLGRHLIVATTRELRARSMQVNDTNPDLRIDFFLNQQTGVPTSGAFIHSHSGMTTWSGFDSRTTATQHMAQQITNGTLIIDVVDTRRGALVFEGLAEGRITESMQDNLAETVSTAVADILAKMP